MPGPIVDWPAHTSDLKASLYADSYVKHAVKQPMDPKGASSVDLLIQKKVRFLCKSFYFWSVAEPVALPYPGPARNKFRGHYIILDLKWCTLGL